MDERIAIKHGSMWVKVGLVQTLIIAPVGPVDPVQQSAIELQYTKEEVCLKIILASFTIMRAVVKTETFCRVTGQSNLADRIGRLPLAKMKLCDYKNQTLEPLLRPVVCIPSLIEDCPVARHIFHF